ncbi:MAG: DUF3293 domain-containing protein, partial [Gammaproteobacteria bacterium]
MTRWLQQRMSTMKAAPKPAEAPKPAATPDSGSPYSDIPAGDPRRQEPGLFRPSGGLTFTDVVPETDPLYLDRLKTWAGDVAAWLGKKITPAADPKQGALQFTLTPAEQEVIFGEVRDPKGLRVSPYGLEAITRTLGEIVADPTLYAAGFPGATALIGAAERRMAAKVAATAAKEAGAGRTLAMQLPDMGGFTPKTGAATPPARKTLSEQLNARDVTQQTPPPAAPADPRFEAFRQAQAAPAAPAPTPTATTLPLKQPIPMPGRVGAQKALTGETAPEIAGGSGADAPVAPQPAAYLGFQEGIGDTPGFHMWNTTEDVFDPDLGKIRPAGSTLATSDLRRLGVPHKAPQTEVPQRQLLAEGEQAAFGKLAASEEATSNVDAFQRFLQRGEYAVLSAEKAGLEESVNAANTADLLAELSRRGYHPIPGEGMYGLGKPERSFIVPGMPEDEALELGAKYAQESVLTPRGLVYLADRSVNPADLAKIDFSGAQDDYFTKVRIGGQDVKFTVPIDFDTKIMPAPPAIEKGVEGLAH